MTTIFTLPPIPHHSLFPLAQVETSATYHILPALSDIEADYKLDQVEEYGWGQDVVSGSVGPRDRGVSRASGEARVNLERVRAGVWQDDQTDRLLFQQVDRLALDPGPSDPYKRVERLVREQAVFRPLEEHSQPPLFPISLPALAFSPEPSVTAHETLRYLLKQSGTAGSITKWIRWDPNLARYRLSSKRPVKSQSLDDQAEKAVEVVMQIGTGLRRLESVSSPTHIDSTERATHWAFRYAIRSYLAHLTGNILLQNTGTERVSLAEMGECVEVLCELAGWPLATNASTAAPLAESAGDLLSTIYQRLGVHHHIARQALAYILLQTATPFMRLVGAWVGSQPQHSVAIDPETDEPDFEDLGISTVTRTVAGQIKMDYRFDSGKLPSFVDAELGERLFEGGRNMRLLREASPGHPLASEWDVEYLWEWRDEDQAAEQVRRHVESLEEAINRWRSGHGATARHPTEISCHDRPRRPPDMLNFSPEPSSAISKISSQSWPDYIQRCILSVPLSHAEIVNKALVTLLFEQLHYSAHLDVLHAYWLGGDALFSERVASALFGAGREDEGRERGMGRRARTRARMGLQDRPDHEAGQHGARIADDVGVADNGVYDEEQAGLDTWGIALGVGLNDRDKWPPGGSELAYALRTTLVDTDVSSASAIPISCNAEARKQVWDKVEDTVSFAIRPLPADERVCAVWKDAQSVQALDFLYLAYTPPSSIAFALPRYILEKYQHVHSLLLKFSRPQVVLRGIYRDLFERHCDQDLGQNISEDFRSRAARIRIEMNHFVETSTGQMMDVAINGNFAQMRKRLDALQAIGHPDAAATIAETDERGASEDAMGSDESEDELASDGVPARNVYSTKSRALLTASLDSLVLDHECTLDDILQSCLLGEDETSKMAYEAMMGSLRSVLDLGKAVRSARRGWIDHDVALKQVEQVESAWADAYHRFVTSLDSLSLKGTAADGLYVRASFAGWLLKLDLYRRQAQVGPKV